MCEYSFRAKEIINRRILPQQTSQTYMYSSFFKRERQYDPFRAKKIINRGILQQQTIMYSSFFKREQQYDPFRAKEIINRGILQQQTIMYSSFFKRELQYDPFRAKLSIEGYYNNKRSFFIKTVSMDSGISNKMRLTLLLWIHHCENQVASRKLLVVIIDHGKFT